MILFAMRARAFESIDEARGVYHLAGSGAVSRYDLARAAIELDPGRAQHVVRKVEPVPSTSYVLPAKRPRFAPLDCSLARARFGVSLPPWRDALARALA